MQPGFDCYGTVIEDLAIGSASIPSLESLTGRHTEKTKEERTLEMREQCRQFVKDSILSQMEDLGKWGIMTDFRYSYFTSSKCI